MFGISSSQVSSIHVPGGPDGKTPVHCWLLRPSSYNPKSPQKYPLFFYMHGGPQVAVTDSWSTRWNALFFAEQGYIVAIPNFTGSDSFGTSFLRAIDGEWGNYPYHDLVRCFSYIETNIPKCDTTRSVAAGGSYGGYLANWIAGQPLARKFTTIISHDGILDLLSSTMGDDLSTSADMALEFGSPLWSLPTTSTPDQILAAKQKWRANNPIENIHKWTQPMLFIHSSNDFRCQITDSWAGYNICKMKGIQTRMLNYPDENHWVLGRENSLRWMRTVIGWCNKYVGNEIEGGVVLEGAGSEAGWVGRGKGKKGRVVEG